MRTPRFTSLGARRRRTLNLAIQDHDLSLPAALIGDPARAVMLARLLEGGARTAGELAREARISPQTASSHLSQLLKGGLVAVASQGRHRYYRLAGKKVAEALESLSLLSSARPWTARTPADLRFARSCYDHLAGWLGVAITSALEAHGHLVGGADAWELTAKGEAYFERLGVDFDRARSGTRIFTRRCLDWSERKDHLAGALGAAHLRALLEQKWLARESESRRLRLTVRGQAALERELDLRFAD